MGKTNFKRFVATLATFGSVLGAPAAYAKGSITLKAGDDPSKWSDVSKKRAIVKMADLLGDADGGEAAQEMVRNWEAAVEDQEGKATTAESKWDDGLELLVEAGYACVLGEVKEDTDKKVDGYKILAVRAEKGKTWLVVKLPDKTSAEKIGQDLKLKALVGKFGKLGTPGEEELGKICESLKPLASQDITMLVTAEGVTFTAAAGSYKTGLGTMWASSKFGTLGTGLGILLLGGAGGFGGAYLAMRDTQEPTEA